MAKAKEGRRSRKTAVKTYHNYIGGEWVKSSSGEWFENVNPADTNDIVGRFPVSNEEDVNRAVEAAKNAADKVAANAGSETCRAVVHARRDPSREQRSIYAAK